MIHALTQRNAFMLSQIRKQLKAKIKCLLFLLLFYLMNNERVDF